MQAEITGHHPGNSVKIITCCKMRNKNMLLFSFLNSNIDIQKNITAVCFGLLITISDLNELAMKARETHCNFELLIPGSRFQNRSLPIVYM